MPASLIMANVQAVLRTLASLSLPLIELIEKINSIVYQNTSADKFVTFFCGILDTENKTFQYINAGHNPPLLFRKDKTYTELTEGGIILGFSIDEFTYKEDVVNLNSGDILVLYTDGITEAMSIEQHEFGENRLKSEILVHAADSAEKLLARIINSVQEHSLGIPQYDDLTLLILKVL
jgi:sigma-B regulation protein RsbU (phosphoserine phosphatase)